MKTKFILCLSTSLAEVNIPESGTHVLVAVSGGEDSMCLLHGLIQIKQEFDLSISVMHVNHGLREAALEDQHLVEIFAQENGLPLYVHSLSDVNRSENENIESWARLHRYRALHNKSKEIDANWIFTAHHGNDQVETLLQRIVEGAGPRGLIGIHKKNGNILRPLLSCSKHDIREYRIENNIPFIYDVTNDDTSFTRNYIRNDVIPILDKRFDQIVKGVDRTSQSMSEVEEVINYALANLEAKIKIIRSINRLSIPLGVLQNVPLLLQVRFLQKTCDMQASLRTHEWNQLKHFLVYSKTGNTINMGDWKILRNRDELILEKEQVVNDEIEWNTDNPIQFQGYQLIGRIHDSIPKMNTNPYNELVDAEKLVSKSLRIRNWTKGDRFTPLGMQSNKKVSDFLTDKKIDVFLKERQFVLTADDDIVWVCGQRISDTYKITPYTNRVMELTMIQK
ncbi:MAG: tRNA lysidine(34) synthetase TilS [Candidatus Marinimicrobia bacterium]|nr:tRNA lysidine(34) synthetase TilS [Candidatus Neomarinimicrobiota bacterium]